MMKRVSPGAHFWIDESARGTRADSGDVGVVIDESRWINIIESTLDQISRFRTQPVS
jgi:hypothetical protein